MAQCNAFCGRQRKMVPSFKLVDRKQSQKALLPNLMQYINKKQVESRRENRNRLEGEGEE